MDLATEGWRNNFANSMAKRSQPYSPRGRFPYFPPPDTHTINYTHMCKRVFLCTHCVALNKT
ncbi:hypothetical protein KY285_003270 [Solanum tuberosum]|nr:hypothetical protein KY284_003441 [Solanum tuberosum]KAH0732341.1 hypothetical protein KY289_003529 [Solanum tuberosum]KAH0767399.1 hypothetical protein KY285_003270 [Solanum tuberosum]